MISGTDWNRLGANIPSQLESENTFKSTFMPRRLHFEGRHGHRVPLCSPTSKFPAPFQLISTFRLPWAPEADAVTVRAALGYFRTTTAAALLSSWSSSLGPQPLAVHNNSGSSL